jgi:hypothetical protein
LNEAPWRPFSAESIRNGYTLADRGLVFNPLTGKCENLTRFSPEVTNFVGTDLWNRIRHQHRLSQHLPLSEGLWLGTHNSFNNAADFYIQFNQQYSMTDQLRLGIRYLDIDINCSPGLDSHREIRMVHSSENASVPVAPGLNFNFVPGMSPFDRPLRNGLEEIRAWLDANPGEFVIISHEERTENARPNELYEMYSRIFGGMIITPAEFESYYGVPSSEMVRVFRVSDWIDGSANGQTKRLLIIMRDKDGGETDAGGLAFRNVPDRPGYSDGGQNGGPAFIESLVAGPVLTSALVSPDHHNLFEGSFQNASMAPLTPGVTYQMARTGVNAIMFEPLGTSNIIGGTDSISNIFGVTIPFEDLLDSVAWSWQAGHPLAGGNRAALVVRSTGRFRSEIAGQQYRFAMQSIGGKAWKISAGSGQYQQADSIVGAENGKLPIWRFAVPGSGLQMQRLLKEMEDAGVDACWVAYDDLDGNGAWDPRVYRDFDQELGSTLWVSVTGSDSNTGESADQPLRTIQAAIDVAPIGTTIRVGPGTYTESIRVVSDDNPGTPEPATRGVAIIGDPNGATIIQAATPNTPTVNASGSGTTLSLSNLWIRNSQEGNNSFGVLSQFGSNVSIRRCTISGTTRTGVYGSISTGELLIEQCTITENGGGGVIFFAGSGSPLSLIASTITDNATSIHSGAGGLHVLPGASAPARIEVMGNIIADNGSTNISEYPYPANSNLFAFNNVIDPLPAATQNNGYAWIGTLANILNQDPNLGPFQFSGGNLPVRVPQSGSPALDYFNTAPSFGIGAVDGRGLNRYSKSTCEGLKYNGFPPADAGAAEYQGDPQSVFYVSAAGNDAWSGQGPSGAAPNGPLATLHEAVSRACEDLHTTIFVSGPTQTEPVYISDKQIKIIALNGLGFDSISPIGNGPVITIDGPEELLFEISGVTVSGGNAPSGAGLRVIGATAVIHDCIIEDNVSTGSGFGGGVSAENGAVMMLRNSVVRRNTSNGTAHGGGLAISNASVEVKNSVFYRNSAGSGAGIGMVGSDSQLFVTHCTVADNIASNQAGAGIRRSEGFMVVRNSVVSRNGSIGSWHDIDPGGGGSNVFVDASIVEGPTPVPGQGNLNDTPRFESAPTGDYRLLVTSPGIDAANPLWSGDIQADIYGSPRAADNICIGNAFESDPAPDMGAFETAAFVDANRNGVNDACEIFGTTDRREWIVSADNLGPFQIYAAPETFMPLVATLEGATPDDQIFLLLDGFTAIEFNLPQCDPGAKQVVEIPAGLFNLVAEDGIVDIQIVMTQPNGPCFNSQFSFSIDFQGSGFDDCNTNAIPDSAEGMPFTSIIDDPTATAVLGPPDNIGVLMTPGRSVTLDLGMGRMFDQFNQVDFIIYGVSGTPISPAGLRIEVSENGYEFYVVSSFGFGNFSLPGAGDHTDPEARINAAIENTLLDRARYIRLSGTDSGSFGEPVNLDAVGILRYERVDPFGSEAVGVGSGRSRNLFEGPPDLRVGSAQSGSTIDGLIMQHQYADLANGPGADLTIYGTRGVGAFGITLGFESISIEVSTDGVEWISINGAGVALKRVVGDELFPSDGMWEAKSFDLGIAGVDRAKYVRVRNLAGTASMLIDSFAFLHSASPLCPKPGCPGDADGNGAVDLADLNIVLANFGTASDSGDLDGDGLVNLSDLNVLLGNFGTVCP